MLINIVILKSRLGSLTLRIYAASVRGWNLQTHDYFCHWQCLCSFSYIQRALGKAIRRCVMVAQGHWNLYKRKPVCEWDVKPYYTILLLPSLQL